MSAYSRPEPVHSFDRSRIARNLGASGGASFAKVLIQLLLLPVMAHLLGPAEFGLYGLALPVVLFFAVISDGGLGISLARERESATLVWSTAFWALLALGVTLAAIVAFWGVVLADLTHQPRLSLIMAILSLNFVFIALSVSPGARLVHRGNLVVTSGADFLGTIAGAIAAVTFAFLGMGAVSLALQAVTAAVVKAAVLNWVAFERPTLEFKFSAIRNHLSTGGYLISGRLIDFSCRFVENLLFGRFLGPIALGNYTFGNQVPRFVSEAVSNPTWSVFYAQALHGAPPTLASLYHKLARLMSLLLFPATFLLAASAPQLLDAILGQKWEGAAIFIQVLAPSSAFLAVTSLANAMFLATGRNKMFLSTFTLISVSRVLAVCLAPWLGAVGVAWALAFANVANSALAIVLGAKLTEVTPVRFLRALTVPTFSSLVGAILCYVTLSFQTPNLLGTFAGILLGGIGFLVTLAVLEGAELKADVMSLKRLLFRARAIE